MPRTANTTNNIHNHGKFHYHVPVMFPVMVLVINITVMCQGLKKEERKWRKTPLMAHYRYALFGKRLAIQLQIIINVWVALHVHATSTDRVFIIF